MVSQEDREKLRNTIQRYIDREINNFQLVDEMGFRSDDMLVREIEFEVDIYMSEFDEHFCEGGKVKEILSRFVLLLQSDYEFPASYAPRVHADRNIFVCVVKGLWDMIKSNFVTRSQTSSNIYWPLNSLEEWETLERTKAD